MTSREFEALKQRVYRLVDDPQQRRKLLLQALNADSAQADREASRHQRAFEAIERRSQIFNFLIQGVAELRPDIQQLEDIPMRQLIALVEPTHPDLAQQLRDAIGV